MRHYFDYNATRPIRAEVWQKNQAYYQLAGNPSSIHQEGQFARGIIESARDIIKNCLHGNHCIFTSCASEANNLAINLLSEDRAVLALSTEHPSVLNNPKITQFIPVEANGLVNLDKFKLLAAANPRALFMIQWANNETGIIQPIKEIAQIIHQNGGILCTDAVQILGKMPMNCAEVGVDYCVISGHKIGAGHGAAALVGQSAPNVMPLIWGGGQESGYRAGTENFIAIANLATAVELACDEANNIPDHVRRAWHQELEANLRDSCPDIMIIGQESPRLPNTSLIIHPHKNGTELVIKLDLMGFAVSSGSACSSGSVKKSATLSAMNIANASNSIRISSAGAIKGDLKPQDFQDLARAIKKIWAFVK